MRRALISTLAPVAGGVPQMAEFIGRTLREGGVEPTFAYYYPYSRAPGLSVPVHQVLTHRVKARRVDGEIPAHALGAWLPELEFMHYHPTRCWRDLMAQSDYHLSVSGNCLAATPYAVTRTRFWSWVATPWAEDRESRRESFPLARRLLDRWVTAPRARKLEKKILSGNGAIFALSQYTQRKLNALVESSVDGVMPMGIDTASFAKAEGGPREPFTVGFVGRLDDPRKNIELLLAAMRICLRRHPHLKLLLIGGGEHRYLDRLISDYQLGDAATMIDHVDNQELPAVLNRMDVFVVPSSQEGLCIAALEAMSCAIPVISTQCGGPEEFVLNGETGLIVGADPEELGYAIDRVFSDQQLRATLGRNARSLIENHYSNSHVKKTFWSSFNATFGEGPIPSAFRGKVQDEGESINVIR